MEDFFPPIVYFLIELWASIGIPILFIILLLKFRKKKQKVKELEEALEKERQEKNPDQSQ